MSYYREHIPVALRIAVLERDDYTCVYCGTTTAAIFHIDHAIPVSAGGDNHPDNLLTACAHCNLSKGAKVYDWAIEARTRRERVQADQEAADFWAGIVDHQLGLTTPDYDLLNL